jgi:hypothetical protein
MGSAFRPFPVPAAGEITPNDPDGYTVLVAYWGKAQQETWEEVSVASLSSLSK